MGPERFVCGDEHFRMISKAEIIIGAKVNYGARFAAVGDHRARICRGEKLGFIQFGGPRPTRIQFVKLAGACSGSLLSPARKLLRLSFAGSSFISVYPCQQIPLSR